MGLRDCKNPLLNQIRRMAMVQHLRQMPDRELLSQFASQGSEAAFRALLDRYGPMVFRVCKRVLGNDHDAEDAYQATFLVLASKAGSQRWQESVAAWLHAVAVRVARKARCATQRRYLHEHQAREKKTADPLADLSLREVYGLLDEELARLPEKYRIPLIQCQLMDRQQDEVARELGCTVRAIKHRLEQGKRLLQKRLAARGVTLTGLLLSLMLSPASEAATVPPLLLANTLRAVLLFVSGREAMQTFAEQASAMISDNVVRLVKGGSAEMTKFSTRFGIWLAGWVSLVGAGLIACQTLKAWPERTIDNEPLVPPAAERPAQEKEKQAHTDLYGDPLPPGALARLGSLRLRDSESEGVSSLVFTPDGKGLLMAGERRPPKLWEVATGKLLRDFRNIVKPQFINGKKDFLDGGALLSPDGRVLAIRSGLTDSLYLLETATGKQKQLGEFKNSEIWKRNCTLSPDGGAIAAQLDDRIELWETATGRTLWQIKDKNIAKGINRLVFSPDGKILASPNWSTGVRLWDARTGELLRTLDPENKICHSIVFSPDSRTLAAAYSEKTSRIRGKPHWSICLWNVTTGKEVRQLKLSEPSMVIGYPVFSPDSKIVATSGGAIRLWDAATGKELRRCQNTTYHWGPAAFSSDGKLLAAMDGPFVRFWDAASGKALPPRSLQGHEDGVNSVAFTPDGQALISTAGDQTVRWWDTRTGQQRLCLQHSKDGFRPSGKFPQAVLSPDGTTLAVACAYVDPEVGVDGLLKKGDTSIRLCDAATGKELRRLDGGKGLPGKLVFSPDGKVLAQSFRMADSFQFLGRATNVVRLWDVASDKRCESKFAAKFDDYVLSPDGRLIITVARIAVTNTEADTVIHFWEAATGKKIHSHSNRTMGRGDIQCVALSPDGQTLAIGSNDGITLYPLSWDKQSGVYVGSPRRIVWPSRTVVLLAFSPDGRMLASESREEDLLRIHVWEVASGKERTCFSGHSTEVRALAFSEDNRRLASGSADTTTLIWDVTGRAQEGHLRSAKFSDKELEGLWADLGGRGTDDAASANDAARAGRAVWALVAAGPQAVSLLGKRLRPAVAKASSEVVARLIADLDAENFKTRQKARDELKKLGETCEPALRQALTKQPSLEMRRSLQELLSQLEEGRKPSSRDFRRTVRAVEVLEQIGTPDARRVLEGWSQGAPGVLQREAQAILKRLHRK